MVRHNICHILYAIYYVYSYYTGYKYGTKIWYKQIDNTAKIGLESQHFACTYYDYCLTPYTIGT